MERDGELTAVITERDTAQKSLEHTQDALEAEKNTVQQLTEKHDELTGKLANVHQRVTQKNE